MIKSDGIHELAKTFSSKEQFECKIISYDYKLDEYDNEILYDALTRGVITEERVRFFRLLYSIGFFDEDVKQLLENIRLNIDTKIDIVAKPKEKEDYIARQIKQLNGIIHSIQNILTIYLEMNNGNPLKTSEKSKHTIIVSPMPLDGMILREDKFNLLKGFTKIILDTKHDVSLLKDFTVTDAYVRTLNESAIWINDLITLLFKKYNFVLEKHYQTNASNELVENSTVNAKGTKPQFETIEEIIPDESKRKIFKEIEIEILNHKRKFLAKKSDGTLHWQKLTNYLVLFITKLSNNDFFTGTRLNTNPADYQVFFEKRYNTKFNQQFEPAKRKTIIKAFTPKNLKTFDDYFLKTRPK